MLTLTRCSPPPAPRSHNNAASAYDDGVCHVVGALLWRALGFATTHPAQVHLPY